MKPETIDAFRAAVREINDINLDELDKAKARITELEGQLARAMNVVTTAVHLKNSTLLEDNKGTFWPAYDKLSTALKDNGWTV